MARPMIAPRRLPRRWSKFAHFSNYEFNNSTQGPRKAAKLGYDAIDLDFHFSKDGVAVAAHWDKPLRHGFYDPLGRTPKDRKISQMSFEHLQRLQHPKGYRIESAWTMFSLCAELGLRVEVEMKLSNLFEDIERMKRLKAVADKVGCEVQAKTLTDIPGSVARLRGAHEAGWTTIVLPRGSKRLSKALYWPYSDYVRGPVKWV